MSGPGRDRPSKKTPLRHSTDSSDELDVFEASRYFSGAEPDHWARNSGNGRRISLDVPSIKNHHNHHRQSLFDAPADPKAPKQTIKDAKNKHKQPSSPGGRIASFLNSLFAQSSAKKNKKPKPDTARKRRTSISHFPANDRTQNNQNDVVLTRIPAVTPTKIAFRSLSDHKQENSSSSSSSRNQFRNQSNRPVFEFEEVEEGGESDSSSDLFELRNYDLGCYELPVYETTHVGSVRAPISVQGR